MVGGREVNALRLLLNFTLEQIQWSITEKSNLKRHLRNIYTKNDAKPHFQNLVVEPKNAKKRAKITWELSGKKCAKYFFQKLEKINNADQVIIFLKSITSLLSISLKISLKFLLIFLKILKINRKY